MHLKKTGAVALLLRRAAASYRGSMLLHGFFAVHLQTDSSAMDGQREGIDWRQVLGRLLKYLVEGIVIAIAAVLIPQRKLDVDEVLVVALAGATTFAMLDAFFPSLSEKVRSGAGWAIGSNLVGLRVGA